MIGRAHSWNSHAVSMISIDGKFFGMLFDGSLSSHVSLHSSVIEYSYSTAFSCSHFSCPTTHVLHLHNCLNSFRESMVII